jgi:hypothetical protein
MSSLIDKLKALIQESHQNPTTPTRTLHLLALADALSSRLEKAPASTALRYHHATEGGLLEHIFEVYDFLKSLTNQLPEPLRYPDQTLLTVSFLHDICKTGDAVGNPYYIENFGKTGRSKAEPFKTNQEGYLRSPIEGVEDLQYLLSTFPPKWSHGEASLALTHALAPDLLQELTPEEIQAIRYHDGGYGDARYGTNIQGKETALTILLHCADMLSSRKRNWEKSEAGQNENNQ